MWFLAVTGLAGKENFIVILEPLFLRIQPLPSLSIKPCDFIFLTDITRKNVYF